MGGECVMLVLVPGAVFAVYQLRTVHMVYRASFFFCNMLLLTFLPVKSDAIFYLTLSMIC